LRDSNRNREDLMTTGSMPLAELL